MTDNVDFNKEFVSRSEARRLTRLSLERLQRGIDEGLIEARFTGFRHVLVRLSDCERLVRTPPAPEPYRRPFQNKPAS